MPKEFNRRRCLRRANDKYSRICLYGLPLTIDGLGQRRDINDFRAKIASGQIILRKSKRC